MLALQVGMALVEIRIDRKEWTKECILGDMIIHRPFGGGSPFPLRLCTLELPFMDNINNVSSIPTGSYSAKVRTDGSKGWRLELIVPGRSNIQIHSGNIPSDVRGCILVGTRRGGKNSVRASQLAIGLLRNEAEQKNPNPEIRVTVFDVHSAEACSNGRIR